MIQKLQGQRFGKLVVLSDRSSPTKPPTWYCECDCGETCFFTRAALLEGRATSCGCVERKAKAKREFAEAMAADENQD